jgi:hypothetical protein
MTGWKDFLEGASKSNNFSSFSFFVPFPLINLNNVFIEEKYNL